MDKKGNNKKKNNAKTKRNTNTIKEISDNRRLDLTFNSKYFNKKNIIILLSIVFVLCVFIYFIFLKDNDLDKVVLETHANEVSEWKYEIDNKDIVKFYKKKRTGDLEGRTNDGLIVEYYTFKALKEGNTTIKFTFMNVHNGSYGEIKEYNVKVDKNLKLTIEEKKD